METLEKAINRISGATGAATRWLTLAMVLIGAFNAVVRYLDRYTGWGLSSNTYIELQWYLFAIVFLFGSAYALREEAHVRVDVLYGRLSRRGRAWTDVLGTLLFLVPFCVLVVVVSFPAIRNSWAVMEQSPDPGGLPRYPIKTIIPVAFVLLLLQGLVLLRRSWRVVRRGGRLSRRDDHEGGAPDEGDESAGDDAAPGRARPTV